MALEPILSDTQMNRVRPSFRVIRKPLAADPASISARPV